jgi:hypothetical protein
VLGEGLGCIEVRGHLVLRASVGHVAVSGKGPGERRLREAPWEASRMRRGLLGEGEGVGCGLREAEWVVGLLGGLEK